MSNVAKDEAELLCAMVDAILKYLTPDARWTSKPYVERDLAAAIRAAGWAVVPQALVEEAVNELSHHIEYLFRGHPDNPSSAETYNLEMKLPRTIRAMLAAAPGVKL